MNDDHEARYVLTERGMRFLAERAGVPPATFAEHAGIKCFDPERGETPEDAVPFPEHALGINRFVARLAEDARTRGWLLAEWLNEAESTHRFISSDGRRSWIRPDASLVVDADGERLPFLLEYDRGTLDGGDFRAKLAGYRRYYAAHAWEARFGREPVLLFVCIDDRAERRVVRAVTSAAIDGPIFTTTEWRYQHGRTLGNIWRDERGERRCFASMSPRLEAPADAE